MYAVVIKMAVSLSSSYRASKQEIAQIYGVLYYQFGREAAGAFFERKEELRVRRYLSGIIREVILGGSPVLFHNPTTGLFTLSWEAAEIIFPRIPSGKMRIFAKRDIFEKHTKKVLLRPAVLEATEDVRPGDEVFIVDERGELLALGKALMSAEEIKRLTKGKVALVRRSRSELQESKHLPV